MVPQEQLLLQRGEICILTVKDFCFSSKCKDVILDDVESVVPKIFLEGFMIKDLGAMAN